MSKELKARIDELEKRVEKLEGSEPETKPDEDAPAEETPPPARRRSTRPPKR